MPESVVKKSGLRRSWLWIVAGVVVVALLALALRPRPIEVDVAEADHGPMQVTLDEEGETRVRDRYVVSAPVPGRVLRIELEPGDPVVAGETVLATLQPAPPQLLDARTRAGAQAGVEAAEADLGFARAELARAEAELRFARSEYERIERLARDRIVSQEMRDEVQMQVDMSREARTAAEFGVDTAEHNLEQARAALRIGDEGAQEPIELRSPVEGVVLRRLRESAAVVNAGEPLLEVADPARLEIVSDYLSEDAVRIPKRAIVLIERWGGDRSLRGVVRRVEPAGFTKISALGVEEQRVNVVVDFDVEREIWGALGDGYRVEVRVIVWQAEDVLKVPTSSLFRHEGDWAVFVAEGGRARLRGVEVGQRNGLEAEVLGGLDENELVIAHPSDTITDGARVAARG